MWGTSSPGDKLTGDFGNEPDTHINQRSWLVSSSGGKIVTRRSQTFATQSALSGPFRRNPEGQLTEVLRNLFSTVKLAVWVDD